MTDDDRIKLTRRKILASTGAVGLAGAGAGLGTSAFFNDTESFEDNTLTAGTLDLKVDWEEHYSYPQMYEGFEDPTTDVDLQWTDPEDEDYVGFPDPEYPHVWIDEDDVSTYMDATAIEAFPDPNDSGSQITEIEGEFNYDPCEDGADLDADLDPTKQSDASRTRNNSTYDEQEGEYRNLVHLEDVKPGDFGELTLSFHLCDNPGYVWLQAADFNQAGGAYPDPEAEAEGDGDPENEANLAENVQTVWWYDTNGNNVIDEAIGEVDVMLTVDTSGSLTQEDVESLEADATQLAQSLEDTGNARVGGLSFGNGAVDNFAGLDDGPVQFSGLDANGNTPMPAALDVAAEELSVNGRSNAETFIIMFSDGGPNYPNSGYTEFDIGGGYTPGPYDNGDSSNDIVENAELCETLSVANSIRSNHRILTVGIDDDGPITNNPDAECEGQEFATLEDFLREIPQLSSDYYTASEASDVGSIISDILANVAMPDEVFRRGTLESDLGELSEGQGVLLDSIVEEEIGDEDFDASDGEPNCFQPGASHYIGFAWWLPKDTGNEVQGDSVSFDLGFFTQQCRNNDQTETTDQPPQ